MKISNKKMQANGGIYQPTMPYWLLVIEELWKWNQYYFEFAIFSLFVTDINSLKNVD